MARIKVPVSKDISKRLISVDGRNTFVTINDLIVSNLDMLFPGMEIASCELFRVTRNAIVEKSEEAANDLLELIDIPEEKVSVVYLGSDIDPIPNAQCLKGAKRESTSRPGRQEGLPVSNEVDH